MSIEAFDRVDLDGTGVDRITEDEVVAVVRDSLSRGRGGRIITPNIDILRRISVDPSARRHLDDADLIVADGMPLIWASRLGGSPLPERVAGSSLIWSLAAGLGRDARSIFVIGGAPTTNDSTANHPASVRAAGDRAVADLATPDRTKTADREASDRTTADRTTFADRETSDRETSDREASGRAELADLVSSDRVTSDRAVADRAASGRAASGRPAARGAVPVPKARVTKARSRAATARAHATIAKARAAAAKKGGQVSAPHAATETDEVGMSLAADSVGDGIAAQPAAAKRTDLESSTHPAAGSDEGNAARTAVAASEAEAICTVVAVVEGGSARGAADVDMSGMTHTKVAMSKDGLSRTTSAAGEGDAFAANEDDTDRAADLVKESGAVAVSDGAVDDLAAEREGVVVVRGSGVKSDGRGGHGVPGTSDVKASGIGASGTSASDHGASDIGASGIGATEMSASEIGGAVGIGDGAARAAARLLRASPGLRIAGTLSPAHGFEEDEAGFAEVCARVIEAQPDLVFVGLGFPKQEVVIERLRPELPNTWFVGCGAAVNFVAGDVARAPRWMQRTGLEWAHRLGTEPRRLAGRYLRHDAPYALRLLASAPRRRAAAARP
ncbi:WecB/TagA/CpsF family glycosyltransferase [Actinoplanes couchii]|uniref:EF-hand domain-containing protein n=1 Tax=Actinoplanes couchii TaxID=403638 RepID=A0ABQ3XBV8_9ACTN|nr:WecB/TagA/CpsF family glycosyltransferase [Actinoplanes couchii]MDR6323490.1 exopolysaccharide biosynthesis WecB/TagA/CpsF family protein [Actinoplanes couchii]GID56007.1 hypothetical protein Aco03nite_044110 [Actinoplanes couchii]